MDDENITKAATFKSLLRLSYKITQLIFLWQCFLMFFARKKLTDDFWGFTQKYKLRVSFRDDDHFFPYFSVSS